MLKLVSSEMISKVSNENTSYCGEKYTFLKLNEDIFSASVKNIFHLCWRSNPVFGVFSCRRQSQSAPDREDYIWGWAQFLNLTSTCFRSGLCFAWTRIWWKMQQIQIFRYVCQVLVVGVFNQCQTRLLVHLIFLFNFLKEFWSGSNRTERGRNRKVLLQQIRF